MPQFLTGKHARVLTLVLLAHGLLLYAFASRPEKTPNALPLTGFPSYVGGWQVSQTRPLEKGTLEVLKADDTLNRDYVNRDAAAAANLFIAFFKTQRTGQAPHSPKNCLPGAGWTPSQSGIMDVQIPGFPSPINVNQYVVSRGEDKSVVLYWYQSPRRVVASEYTAKFWLVTDAIRYRRSDTSLVRVVVPVRNGDEAAATAAAVEFVKAVYPELYRYLPS